MLPTNEETHRFKIEAHARAHTHTPSEREQAHAIVVTSAIREGQISNSAERRIIVALCLHYLPC
jgi:hypothetical protein